MGGGGYLDPLDRDPELVLTDYINGAVSLGHAHDCYGVVVDPDEPRLDRGATDARRAAIRVDRRASAAKPDPSMISDPGTG
jgi:N-methylhydantoinase B